VPRTWPLQTKKPAVTNPSSSQQADVKRPGGNSGNGAAAAAIYIDPK
jgi:hypothetical protein